MTSKVVKLIAFHLPILTLFVAMMFFVARSSVQAEATAENVDRLSHKLDVLEKAAWAVPRIESELKDLNQEVRELRKALTDFQEVIHGDPI